MEQQTLPLNPLPDASAPEEPVKTEEPVVSLEDRVAQHYADTIGGLVEDASKSKTVPALANVMAFSLARLIVDYGAVAAGHVLGRLGAHISYLLERDRAAQEAVEAREAGRLPH